MWQGPDFRGAKVALIVGEGLLTYQRDEKPDIPFPGMWDLPGGGREGDESPEDCALREVEEEFGLILDPACIVAVTYYPARTPGALGSYFLLGSITAEEVAAIRFGSEGQRWALMSLNDFIAHPEVIPQFKARLHSHLGLAGCVSP